MLIIIAAHGKNKELGENGKLPWYLPDDLEFFKKMTMGSPIVMGRKTFESLDRLLPNREHIVITKDSEYKREGIKTYSSIESFLDKYKLEEDVYIVGGESIYRQMIDYANLMYLTEINKEYPNADTFFPDYNKEDWQRQCLSNHSERGVDYCHAMYIKKKKR